MSDRQDDQTGEHDPAGSGEHAERPGLRNVRGDDAHDHRADAVVDAAVGTSGAGESAVSDPAGENATIDQFVADDDAYLLEVKRSARKRNPAVGEAVFREGAYHRFADRERADEWARALADAGERSVWVQDAPPHDETPFDGYLVSRRPRRPAEAPFESEQTDLSEPS